MAELEHMEIAPYYWFDGALSQRETVSVDPFAHGLHYGSGVFEGIRSYATPHGTGIFRLREHMERFLHSAAVYSLNIRYSLDELCEVVVATMRANQLKSAYIRPLAFFGEKTIALAASHVSPTHVLIALRAFGDYFGPGQDKGIRATISPWRKFSSKALPSTVKGCGHYANSVLAMQDAVARGFNEAILLNDRGEVAEGTGENIFVVANGAVLTNDRSADVLHGITRASVLELCADMNIPVEIGPITLDALLDADEAFFTGTAVEVTPIACIDDRIYPSERPVATRLAAAYRRAVNGDDERHANWVTWIRSAVSDSAVA
jgi:branched-chain amino acid aminotransferase